MAESESSSSSKSKTTKAAASTPLEEAQAQGYIGQVPDDLPNEAYTVSGQGPETAKHEREAGVALRQQQREASQEG